MATLNTAATYYPLPTTARFATLKDESVTIDLTGALSFSLVDESCYRQVNYRDELPAAFAGGPAAALGSNYALAPNVPTPGDQAIANTSSSVSLSNNNTIIVQSDSYAHVAPRTELFKRTMMVFWSGATGSGNVVAYFDFSKFDQFSTSAPARY